MRLRNFIIAFTVISAVLLVGGIYASATGAPPEREAPTATVAVAEGQAFLLPKGGLEWVAVGVPTPVSPGDRVRTGENSSAVMVFFDQSTARLDADTEVEVEALEVDGENFTNQRVNLAVVAGRVWSRIVKFLDADSSYTVETSTLVATVRGTAFLTDVREEENHRVFVLENKLGVSLVRPSQIPGGPRTLGPASEVAEGEEAGRESVPTFEVIGELVRVKKFLEDVRRDNFIVRQLKQDEEFLKAVQEARERKVRRLAPGALPGSVGYPLKRLGEKLRMSLTTDPEARRELRLAYASRRLSEAVQLVRAGKEKQAVAALKIYNRDLFEEMRRIDPRAPTLTREQAVRRFKKVRGRIREHEDLISALGVGGGLKDFVARELLRDPEISRLEIPELTKRIDDAYREPPRVLEEPLYKPRIIEAEPAPTAPESPESGKEPLTNTNKPTATEPPPTNANTPTNTNQPAAVTPVSLAVLGTKSIMTLPDTQQFRAMIVYSDDSTKDVTELADWSLQGDIIGSIRYGFLTTSEIGSASVTAVYQGLRGSYSVLVKPAVVATLDRVSVSCPNSTISYGGSQQCSATAYYSDNATRDVTNLAVWSLSNPQVGTISSTGYFTATTPTGQTAAIATHTDGDITKSGSFTINIYYQY
ncbi:hypothetical protein A3D72_03980 [Candidatus Uhrbacteria bacterium RIFCSPHIGHO2_02_FULL_57_19]|uniref:BIG2 domain-containing protein n=1 Tax=Candidatus Uhrbacteria bacterium RIFCSPHIGHO2_02_FULL_57_19 TaxID=1802391 RepID=A0A1F7U6R3_9BACT|nr:MAG: hypothetical protein A3D72_03980 [Candidatus Uhrbacteria bacterium RIFCSPHIGHO2_02_FULL_57_19]